MVHGLSTMTWSLCSALNINDNYNNAIKYSVHLGTLHTRTHTFIIVNYNMRINRFECIFVVQFEQITCCVEAYSTHSDTSIQMAKSIDWMHHWILDRLVVCHRYRARSVDIVLLLHCCVFVCVFWFHYTLVSRCLISSHESASAPLSLD